MTAFKKGDRVQVNGEPVTYLQHEEGGYDAARLTVETDGLGVELDHCGCGHTFTDLDALERLHAALGQLLEDRRQDQEPQQGREARRRRFNVDAESVERRKAEMTAAELKYRRATATPDHPLAEPDPEVERRAAVRALREAVADMRRAREGSWNLRDPRDPEVAYSVDVWLEVRANRLAADGPCGDHSTAEPDHTGNEPRPLFSRGLSYPDPAGRFDEEEGEWR